MILLLLPQTTTISRRSASVDTDRGILAIVLGHDTLICNKPKLLNTILGGNMSSRLFQEIRERRGLAYSIYSFVNSYFDTGMFGVYAGVDPARANECVDVIIKEIRKTGSQHVTTSELHNAKEHTKGNLLLSAESVDNHMVRLAQTDIHFGRYIPIQEVIEKIESVTLDDILAVAENLFQPETYALTILGPVDNKSDYENLQFVQDSGINADKVA